MAVSSRATPLPPKPDEDPAWSPATPAVATLLDRLAEELAREYVQLMEQVAQEAARRRDSPKEA